MVFLIYFMNYKHFNVFTSHGHPVEVFVLDRVTLSETGKYQSLVLTYLFIMNFSEDVRISWHSVIINRIRCQMYCNIRINLVPPLTW